MPLAIKSTFLLYILQVPEITESAVKAYLDLFDQDLRSKPKDMYHGKFLRTIRIATDGTHGYVKGQVSAEMKKSMIYHTDIKFDRDNIIRETQCDCAAGMGPDAHCKHVALVLYALTHAKTGIVTMETCTQQLQTFHQAKKHNGSPVKMEDLKLRRKGGLSKLSAFEPRPQEMIKMETYPHLFRQVCLNSRGENLPIRQIFPPANIYAIHKDHNYSTHAPEQEFCDKNNLTSITPEVKAKTEESTREQSKSKLWATERTKRLQASMYGRICRATHRTDMAKLAQSLTETSNLSAAPILHGRKYEPKAAQDYAEEKGVTVEPSGIVVSETTSYLACSPDGLIGKDGILEIKCPYTTRDKEITPVTVPFLYFKGKDLALKENHKHYYQVMGTLMCTERKWCDFVVWTFPDIQIIRIERDEPFIQEMKKKLTDFYENFFKCAVLDKYVYKRTSQYTFD